jgi:rhomboid protease GluP
VHLIEELTARKPNTSITKVLIFVNVFVFIIMLFNGAGLWHSPNNIQLTWGANFGPATQDGEWWRLASAMFLHFGVVHLALNCFSLWEVGQLTERMYSRLSFIIIYFTSGLFGNLFSLVIQGNVAVSGGASGAIFGLYAALLTFLWREKSHISNVEFRWLFWGAFGLAAITILLGFIVPGIDNAAHIGGFVAGGLTSIIFSQAIWAKLFSKNINLVASFLLVLFIGLLAKNIPSPKYRWSEELLLRNEINQFLYKDQSINRSWLDIVNKNNQGLASRDEIAGQIDSVIVNRYDETFEKLSKLPTDPNLPSATQLQNILQYTQLRMQQSKSVADNLRVN